MNGHVPSVERIFISSSIIPTKIETISGPSFLSFSDHLLPQERKKMTQTEKKKKKTMKWNECAHEIASLYFALDMPK